jgi:hypothetical protein
MKAIRAQAVPSTDKVLRVKTPKSYYGASVDDHIAKAAAAGAGAATPETNATGDLHKALMSVGDQMLQYHDKPASLATVGHALKQVALKIAPSAPDIGRSQAPEPVTKPEIGERDTSRLFGTPSPDREAV